jgi:hypothetical protein
MADCVRCARPVADTGYVCHSCSTGLSVVLLRAALYAVHLDDTIARLDRVNHGVGGRPQPVVDDWWPHGELALEAQPLPVALSASYDASAVRNTLTTWTRHVWSERGGALPSDALPGLFCWMAGQTRWLRMRQEAQEAFDELHDAARVTRRVIDSPPRRALAGQCGCGTYLYAIEGRVDVTCQGCGTTYDVLRTRTMLLAYADGLHLPAAELAILAVHLGLTEDRHRTRKLINKWINRASLPVWVDEGGEPVLRVGDVMARLTDRMVAA